MFVNLDKLPAGQALYTLAVTSDPVETPRDLVSYDEIDVVAPAYSTAHEVVEAAREEIARDYESTARVVGVADQSKGYVMWQNSAGDLLGNA